MALLKNSERKPTNVKDFLNDLQHVCIDESLKPLVVYFDLETTGLSRDAEIIQIAAKYEDKLFSVYINPKKQVTPVASKITRLKKVKGILCEIETDEKNGKKYVDCKAVPQTVGIMKFYEFLLSLKRKCILTAHNNVKFDCPRLLRAIQNSSMTELFEKLVFGFSDTLPIIEKIQGRGGNSLGKLASSLGISKKGAHNAIVDVEILSKIVESLNISYDEIKTATLSWVISLNKVTPGSSKSPKEKDLLKNLPDVSVDENLEPAVVYFHLETTGLSDDDEIIQIIAKHKDTSFSVYINPKKQVSVGASRVNHLKKVKGVLCKIETDESDKTKYVDCKAVSLTMGVIKFYEFLYNLKKICILTAHNNVNFDCPRLIRAVGIASLTDRFQKLVFGFCDTLPIIEKIRGKGFNTLKSLATICSINAEESHIEILEKVVEFFNISFDEMKNISFSWTEYENFSRNKKQKRKMIIMKELQSSTFFPNSKRLKSENKA